LRLAVHCYKALYQPHQVTNLQVNTTTTVDRAGAIIVASMVTNNLKIAMLCLEMTQLFIHGDAEEDDA
jgi:hypothetical protein